MTNTQSAGAAPRLLRAIVDKELRGGLRSGVVALLTTSALMGLGAWLRQTLFGGFSGDQQIVVEQSVGLTQSASPSPTFLIGSIIAALVIGFGQIARERRGDQWAFVVHRPVNRSTLFWGKIIGGVTLYVAATGIPLLVATAWLSGPGQRAPFDLRMQLPLVADMLCGLVYYFAVLMTAMRDARWYASRAFGFGVALICSLDVASAQEFWQAVVVVAVGIAITSLAALGAFATGGRYGTQRGLPRGASALAVGSGSLLVGCVAIAMLVAGFSSSGEGSLEATEYRQTNSGQIIRVTTGYGNFGPPQVIGVADLDGRPLDALKDSTTRSALTMGVVTAFGAQLNPDPPYERLTYRSTDRFVMAMPPTRSGGRPVAWYFVRHEGLIAAYDPTSGHLIGWLGPDGFTSGGLKPATRFVGQLRPSQLRFYEGFMVFPTAVYQLDLANSRVKRLFAGGPDEEILGFARSAQTGVTSTDRVMGLWRDSSPANLRFDLVTTTRQVYVVPRDSGAPRSFPLDPRTAGYGTMNASRTSGKPSSTFLWYSPNGGTPRVDTLAKLPVLVTEFATDGKVIASHTLPPIRPERGTAAPAVVERVVPVVIPPLAMAWSDLRGYSIDDPSTSSPDSHRQQWLLSLLGALIGAVGVVALSRFYAQPLRRVLTWIGIAMLTGPLAVPWMAALIEWPAREACPSCGRKRIVIRDRCEHCDAAFSAPARDGTEVFDADLIPV